MQTTAQPHSHMFLGASHDDHARRTLMVVALTFAMMIIEIVAGYITESMALLADGFHMATHAGALAIAAAAYAYARRHADNASFSFGTGKVGDLAGFASALILAMVSLGIAAESIARLLSPGEVAFGEAAVVAVVGLVVNVVSAVLLSGGSHHGHGHHHGHDHAHHRHEHPHHDHHGGDNNLRSAYMHVIADALTSVLAIAALLGGQYLGWSWLDPLVGLLGATVIARWAYGLMKDSAAVLLDRTDQHVADEIRELIATDGRLRLVDLHVWQVGPAARAAIVSVAGRGASLAGVRELLAPVDEVAHLTVEYAQE